MAKRFNITGTCFPDENYMADVSSKMNTTYKMIEDGEYFMINRPRQYGKTTTLYTMADRLNQSGKYLVFNISFEGLDDEVFESQKVFAPTFLRLLAKSIRNYDKDKATHILKLSKEVDGIDELADVITDLVIETDKKIVVLIDEVDKSSNYKLFLSFLAMLRTLYLQRKTTPTFHSVILAGVHDIKSLKLKIRKDEAKTYNSPWNIAIPFLVDMNLSPAEIKPMLDDYAEEQGVAMNSQAMAELLFHYTSGYPYLTSHLCKIIAENFVPIKEVKEWTEKDVYKAFQVLIREPYNANFDTLMKNLREYPDLYKTVYSLVIEGAYYAYNQHDATISLGILHGIFAQAQSGELMIHNRIYREIIGDMMISEWRTGNAGSGDNQLDGFNAFQQYYLPNNALDMHRLVLNFQEFMRQNYSEKDRKFLERDGRLIFLAFLKPLTNGAGHDFKEPQVSEERRLDLAITYYQHKYVIELKIWKGPIAHDKGLFQLADYLEKTGLDTGYLVIFDHSKNKLWTSDWIDVNGKRIFWVRV